MIASGRETVKQNIQRTTIRHKNTQNFVENTNQGRSRFHLTLIKAPLKKMEIAFTAIVISLSPSAAFLNYWCETQIIFIYYEKQHVIF